MFPRRRHNPNYLYRRLEEPRTPRVALAVLIPLVGAFLFGMAEIGSAFFTQHMVRNAAVEGVRFGIAESTGRPDGAQVTGYVRRYLSEGGLDPDAASIVVTGVGGTKGTRLNVDVSYRARLLVMSLLADWTPAVGTATAATNPQGEEAPRADTITLHGKAVGILE